jgi:hypothetical protein
VSQADAQPEAEVEREYWPVPAREWPREWPVELDLAAGYDYVGRKLPRRMDFVIFARALAGYAGLFAGRVPGEFYIQVEPHVVDVSCPCGHTPRCERMIPEPCACGRVFAYTGGEVRVAYPDGWDPERS